MTPKEKAIIYTEKEVLTLIFKMQGDHYDDIISKSIRKEFILKWFEKNKKKL